MTSAAHGATLRRQTIAVLHQHGRADISSLASALEYVERTRGLRIEVGPSPALDGGSICGLLIVGEERCMILHAGTSTPLHRLQCILHELGHLLLEHDKHGTSGERLGHLVPGIEIHAGDHLFGRHNLSHDDEAAAELLADLLAVGIRRGAPLQSHLEEFFG